ncbi:putative disease resistance RPP13-like protein 3 isoform X2 [Daucus carota subsp. sativus]|uniref:putative disease resistance RPP13-like protein 3 isoform X2 n=1 Tax=Daucus carota subsp. sativus TaxID=79200 RepID=UPI0007EF0E54|nr:PREDICTED: putative disease resistance RPP13-like protein 3 isoform X2 [Daucus carota subsp. sativus]
MVDAVVSSAITMLGEFIVQEVNIRLAVKDNVRWLRDELGFLQSSVRQAESRQEEDLVRDWVNNVRDVANDAIAILRKFSDLQQEHAAPKRGVLDCFRGMCKKEATLYDIGNDIESLKERIVEIKNRRTDYRIDNILATPSKQQKERSLLRTTAIDIEVEVVGFEEDINILTAEIDSTDPFLKVIYIHGMGGLGKTSLATKLHNSHELRHFDTRAKVCISSEYDIKDVLKRIIKSFMGPEHEQHLSNLTEHDLLQYLSKLLQDRGRYFALIDDIWDMKVWEQIKIAFPDVKNGSRIIITTRNKDVTRMADDKCFVHPLRFLMEEESWQLFCKKAEPTTKSMDKLGREMVGKCGGLPLAIVVLSGLLSEKPKYEYWSNVKEHIWRHLKDGGSFRIEDILSLSYNGLTSKKKRDCFLYLARFAEDQIINVDRLKLLWIAEKFISEADELDGVAMEDLAEDYLNELINRNLIQIATLLWNGKVSHCRVHDLVHELAINKAKELKLLGTFDSSQHPKTIALLEGQPRHAIYNGIAE